MSARPSARRCRCPPESSEGKRDSSPESLSSESMAETRPAESAQRPAESSSGSARFSLTRKTEMLPDEACAHVLNRTDSALRRGPPDRPRNRRPQPRKSGEKRRLPATGLADDGKRGPRRQRQIQPLNDGPAVVAKRKPVAGQSRRLKRLFPLILHAHLRITDGSPRCRKRAPT